MNGRTSGRLIPANAGGVTNVRLISQKIARLQAGGKPRVLDLFSGCGGLSLGFQAAGYEISAAIELDPHAAKSHGENFHTGKPCHSEARDITRTPPKKLTAELKLGEPASAFDVIVGGPPCQAFARVGRSKLREVADHPEAFRHDPRSRLYIEYIDYVKACTPLAVVLENVPDMLNFGGHNIAHEICEVLSSIGYVCGYTLLNAAMYGVPQMRDRAFLIAVRKEVMNTVSFPPPTHQIELPAGYEGTRAVAMKLLTRSDTHGPDCFWRPSPEANADLPPAVTAWQALSDLPPINAMDELANGRLKRGARRFDVPIPYPESDELSDYARCMREWVNFAAPVALKDHVIRYLPRDYKLFARLSPGDQYPEAYRVAEAMFAEALTQRAELGSAPSVDSEEWNTLRAEIVPPYDHTKFPNKWRKMEADKPARTLMAHLGKDGYSHIHYDNQQARTISVREAARLQSFPDGFRFFGTMNPAFRQIGNAVPPLLAKAIGANLLKEINAALMVSPREVAAGGR
ncbi:DNA cytosine methyltransferase [Kordiimonas aestuarii]|uniref:DNA cytosine methyltransferase n=1 Tax=Kordiimonas aestuarii TaxID=1005925 RepID=UPI0021D135BC|nr:DNA cytosine methyltransferase [Kordiimonas aestuarii]